MNSNTTTRDRLPFPASLQQSPVSSRVTASTSSSQSVQSAPSVATQNHPATLESLLSLNANAASPPLAALEQAISERNILSSQNSQLWKLIEKQRTGYNQILKELDRVRTERDGYKNKLVNSQNAQNGEPSAKRHRDTEKDKSLKHSSSHPGVATNLSSSSSSTSDHTSRTGMIRHLSDDQTTPRKTHHVHSSRSQEPLVSHDRPSFPSNHSSLALATPPSTRGPKATPPPLFGPHRSDSLPAGSSTPTASTTYESGSFNNLTITRPLTISPRKPTIPDVSGNIVNLTPSPPQQPPQPSMPQTTPTVYSPSGGLSSIQPQIAAPLPSSGLLSTTIEHPSSRMLSRESRISLPDEAKQYIANMGDSPVPSPKLNGSYEQTQPHPPLEPPLRKQGNIVADLSSHPHPSLADKPRDAPPAATMIPFASSKDTPKDRISEEISESEFLDMDDDDGEAAGGEEDDDGNVDQSSSYGHTKPGAVAEDFPLPPSNAPAHIQVQSLAQAQAHAHAESQGQVAATHKQQQANDLSLDTSYPVKMSSETYSSPYIPQDQPNASPASFRALPLLASDLPFTQIQVSNSSVRPNDRGKDVLSFIVSVDPGHGKDGWRVEKLYSDVLGLDQRVRASVGKGVGKKIGNLPEGKLWRDHAPAKVDQRKAALETYLQTLINLPVKNKDEVIAFFTSDIVRETKKPVSQVGYKEGYLTKRGKNFGGWKTRYFVLQGPVLEYYESRGGAHLGSIVITGAQIGRQQRSGERLSADDEKEYRHAFLIVEAKKGPGGNNPRHVLCAESDIDRDAWVEMLVRYVMGTYNEEPVSALGPSPILTNQTSGQNGMAAPRSSTGSISPFDSSYVASGRRPVRAMSKDEVISKGPAVPINQLTPDASNAKLFQTPPPDDLRPPSPARSVPLDSPIDRQGAGYSDAQNAKRLLERGQQASGFPEMGPPLSSSLPTSASPLETASGSLVAIGQRANSSLGLYSDTAQDHRAASNNHHRDRKPFHPTLNIVASTPNTPNDRAPSPEKLGADGKVKISAPINGTIIPAGYKFGGKDAPPETSAAANERREKAKSRSFWGFGRPNDKSNQSAVTFAPRAVFGVPLEESLDVAQIANLPAIVFRSIQYLEAKQADQEEGIYRLSGSSAVIKSLKDRFNMEGDVDLLGSDEYWDPHAIAGLLKSFLRDLPASILTRDHHLKFLAVIDFVDPQERIKELSQLIAALPLANYSLLRALTAHLILIVQNSSINKMTMRNVGIVFSPTLGIPAGVLSLMLGEFNRVFNVDADNEDTGSNADEEEAEGPSDRRSAMSRRNSRQYSDGAADQLLGLSGRTLSAPAEEGQSDGDDFSVQDESGTDTTEGEATIESSDRSSPGIRTGSIDRHLQVTPDTPNTPSAPKSKASHVAATRGLNIAISTSDRGNRHSRMMGLPSSPRSGPPASPMYTPKS